MKKPQCKYTDFSIPVKGYNAKLCFTTYNKKKGAFLLEKDAFSMIY